MPPSPLRILLVMADPFARERLMEDLGRGGVDYRLRTARDGESALAQMRSAPPRLLLVDAPALGKGLPRLLGALAEDPALSRVPVFVLREDTKPLAPPLGLSLAQLSRPFSLSEFRAVAARAGLLPEP